MEAQVLKEREQYRMEREQIRKEREQNLKEWADKEAQSLQITNMIMSLKSRFDALYSPVLPGVQPVVPIEEPIDIKGEVINQKQSFKSDFSPTSVVQSISPTSETMSQNNSRSINIPLKMSFEPMEV
jgi:hypothetical protein